jgi:hypothetical protein
MGDKAVFESRDLSPPFQQKDAGKDKTYLGVQRRKGQRRSGCDRRESVRFENGATSDRRVLNGRRDDDQSVQFW